jgi:hypothetical protein
MAAKKKTSTNPNETKEERFVRLANARTGKAIKAISSIGKLGGANYTSTPDQRRRIEDVLEEAIETMVARLKKEKVTEDSFKL